jgi:hypothetical protein
MPSTPFMGVRISWLIVARKPRFRPVARDGDCLFERLALGDVAPDALDFHDRAARIADGEILPRNPAPAIDGSHLLVVAHAAFARLQSREAAEILRMAVGMQFRREGLSDHLDGLEPKELEESIVAVAEAAVGQTTEDRIALRIDEALIARFALMQLGVHRRGVAQRLLQAGARDLHLRRLRRKQFALLTCCGEGVQHEAKDREDERAEKPWRHEREMARDQDIAQHGHEHGQCHKSQAGAQNGQRAAR